MSLNKREIPPYLSSIIGGACTAIFSLLPPTASFLFLLLNYLSAVPLLIVYLALGVNAGTMAALACLGLIFLIKGSAGLLLIGATTILPCSLLATLALRKVSTQQTQHWYPVGKLVSWLTLLCLSYILITGLLFSQYETAPDILIKETLEKIVGQDLSNHMSASLLLFIPSFMSLSLSMMALVNLSLAQRICVWRGINLRPYPTEYDDQFHEFWDIVFVFSFMHLLTDDQIFAFIGKNVMMVSCLPLFVIGLSTVSCWLNKLENGRLWLGILIILCVLLLWPALVIITLGLLEPTMKIKKRLRLNKDLD
jgi:hypothetical protein